ncbi:MAG: PqiC family protein [Candidatus Thiodiazotropha lotti]|nr:PqiC family protein [Candidatus Thiodiazotropha lotti]MCG8004804.1 PqiC family protein [Candidatus Thiodiazotropha lotti]MCG8006768.1 PqiC family protein [Candidatus Thiodiazotropha lotti]MCW4188431.1 PqiC family protein [Candidatus Thiodiazotropha lotti]MCW4194350.1 PqiC family protein [Candidatus Thiodiazotropha lotti]
MKTDSLASWLVVFLLISLCIGCASPSQPTRFYRLDGGIDKLGPVDLTPRPGGVVIGIDAIELAGYLDRPQIIERTSSHRLELYEFEQWAGSLQENLLALIRDRIQQQLSSMQVIAYPWPLGLKPDYELKLVIQRFERVEGSIELQGLWTLVETDRRRIVLMQQNRLQEPIQGETIEAGVVAASVAASRFSEQIAEQMLQQIDSTEKAR